MRRRSSPGFVIGLTALAVALAGVIMTDLLHRAEATGCLRGATPGGYRGACPLRGRSVCPLVGPGRCRNQALGGCQRAEGHADRSGRDRARGLLDASIPAFEARKPQLATGGCDRPDRGRRCRQTALRHDGPSHDVCGAHGGSGGTTDRVSAPCPGGRASRVGRGVGSLSRSLRPPSPALSRTAGIGATTRQP